MRTITMGISLLDCIDSSVEKVCENVYNKITTLAKNLVSTGKDIEKEYGIPIVNKRISVTPIALVGSAACKTTDDFVEIAKSLDRAAKEVGVNFLGGYSALVSKGMTKAEELLIRSIPKALAVTERVCSSVNIGSTKTGINMDAVRLMGNIVKEAAEYTKDQDSLGCAKLVEMCIRDSHQAASAFFCGPVIEKQLEEEDMSTLYKDIEMPVVFDLGRMEQTLALIHFLMCIIDSNNTDIVFGSYNLADFFSE